ncbi:hypothetical protein [Methanotorris igneus]|uniref:Uncharacterized protein n=1 Tax=Methanotorris igneus (strain DSM 5666 / JCM 11834 / Kol 5) TaxID=880724 RepID=F6BCW0_METIK|nr:hypothetical protein [Methanotorris igneus]AEF96321.1 hypothetical protein Metig_0775 [Methanotorris igneus Kol 5]
MRINNNINLNDFKTNNFSKEHESLKNLPKEFINFDEIGKGCWSQLRTVDMLDVKDNSFILMEITNLKNTLYNKSKKFKISVEIAKEFIKSEYREKLMESLLLLSLLTNNLNNKRITFKLILYDKKEDIFAYEYLKSYLNSILQEGDKCKITHIEDFIKYLNKQIK